jgi:probable rRNA maturation factor
LSALFFLMILIEPAAESVAKQAELHAGSSALKMRELRTFLTKAKSAVGLAGEVSVLLATDATLRALNRDYRKKDNATDVLSFPVEELPGETLKIAGDLAISVETAQKQAEENGHSLQMEVKILMLHGLLHLAGFDHELDNGQMARRENALRKELDLPVGLIQRSGQTTSKSIRVPSKKRSSIAGARGRLR